MPILANLQLIRVHGRYVKLDGTPAQGTVTFTPNTILVDPVSREIVKPVGFTAQLDAQGRIIGQDNDPGVLLPATDDPDLDPQGWSYQVAENIVGVLATRRYALELPYDLAGGTFDLSTVSPSAPPTSGTSNYVTIPALEARLAELDGADPEVIQQAVLDYLTANPPAGSGDVTSQQLADGLATKQDVGDYIEEGDPRLTDARTPTSHSHDYATASDVADATSGHDGDAEAHPALRSRLTALEEAPSGGDSFVPDPSSEADNRWLRTSGGQLVYGPAPEGGSGSTAVFDVRDYGATGDNVTDDGPAFAAALADLADLPAGFLYLPTPSVAYRIATTLGTALVGKYGLYGFIGQGSTVRINVGTGVTAFPMWNAGAVTFDGIRFIGSPPGVDCANMVSHAGGKLRFVNCNLTALNADAGVIYCNSGELELGSINVLGCSGGSHGVVRGHGVQALTVEDVTFFDIGSIGGVQYNPRGPTPSWMSIEAAADPSSAWPQGTLYIRNLKMDEGATDLIRITGGTHRYRHAHLVGVQGNISTNAAAAGIRIDGVETLTVEGGQVGYLDAPFRDAMKLSNIGSAHVRGFRAFEGANRITVESTVDYLELVDCVYTTLVNDAQASRVFVGAPPATAPSDQVQVVVYSGNNGAARPSAVLVIWADWPEGVDPDNAQVGRDIIVSPEVAP